jgi:TatD DNase family protein
MNPSQEHSRNTAGTTPLADTHCHLDLSQFDGDRAAVIARAQAAGVQYVVNPGIHLASCRRALALAEEQHGVYAAVGVHPNEGDCAMFDDRTAEALQEMAARPKVVAIGEIGLDYYWQRVPPEQQKLALRRQLALAADLDLPVILHSRQSNADLLWELAQLGPMIRKKRGDCAILGIWHAFSGDAADAATAYELGFLLGLGGPVTFQNARSLRELVPDLRSDRLVLETDAPYLTPHPHRGRRNEPAYLPLVADALAELYGMPADLLVEKTTTTALRCFKKIVM